MTALKAPTLSIATVDETVTITKKQIALTGQDIRALLWAAGFNVPPEAAIAFEVPRGGDYSGTRLEINDENPVTIRWGTETRSVDSE